MSLRDLACSMLLVALLLGGCASDAEKARQALALGKQQQASGALVDAAAQLSDAVRLDPRLHEAFARLALVRLAQDDARAAETAALRAAALVPRSSYYSELLGRTQLAGHRNDAGIASLEQAITLDPAQTARLAFTIGVRRERQGKLPEAQAAYERAATADARAVLPRLALARLHLGTGRLDDAKRRLDESRAQVPATGAERELFARLDARATTLLAERDARARAAASEGFAANDQVISAGIFRLLGALDSGTSLFGSDVLGNDGGSALGGMQGDTIGDSFGFGGLGLTGTGGGGGTGEGTIGLGNLGTIGHGAGPGGGPAVGYGMGRMVGAGGASQGAPATVTPGAATVMGSLSVDVVRRVVRAHLGELRYCYEAELTHNATLAGTVSMSFVIDSTGAVTSSSAPGIPGDPANNCFASSAWRWTFPAPAGGGIVRVTYPIILAPPAAPPPVQPGAMPMGGS